MKMKAENQPVATLENGHILSKVPLIRLPLSGDRANGPSTTAAAVTPHVYT